MDWEDIGAIIFGFIVGIFIASTVSYTIGQERAYLKAVDDTILYHEATGHHPSNAWVEDNRGEHFNTEQDILDSLRDFMSR